MGLLIRIAFWFSLVLLALPLDAGGPDSENKVGAIEAIIAAGEAVTDMAGMCERKPEVCETGRQAVSTITSRAREVSRIAYKAWGEADPQATGSVEPLAEPATEPAPLPVAAEPAPEE